MPATDTNGASGSQIPLAAKLAESPDPSCGTISMPAMDTNGVSGSQFPLAAKFGESPDLSCGTSGMNGSRCSAFDIVSSCSSGFQSMPMVHVVAGTLPSPSLTLPQRTGGFVCSRVSLLKLVVVPLQTLGAVLQPQGA
eukprot:CAMPEP_0172666048 /NCGR_PEP_ID=MMETSP1074-20121228/7587_1 /TAXON_ID=2916 /ORGANISM="Ceratium fusus, Strain PA161109" /LENGTH=137 /DNA_ID=CAMNT_0013482403 /DNA_START=571 /DNA_END=985 /DNA_ORIENTATION=-